MTKRLALCGYILVFANLSASFTWAADSHEKSAEKQKIAFSDLSKIVMEKNENVEAANLHTTAQKLRTGRLGRSFMPQLSATAGAEQFRNGTSDFQPQDYWKIEGTFNLYRGGRDRLEDKIRSTNLNLSRTLFSAVFQKELKEARLAYWNILAFSRQIADRNEALKINETNLRSAKRRAGAGLTTTADAKQFELHRISLNREIAKLKLEMDLSRNQLALASGLNEHKNIEVVGEFPEVSSKDFDIPKALTDKHLTVKLQKDLETIEQLKANQSSAWWQPRVDLYADVGLPALSDETDRAVGKRIEQTAGIRFTVDLGQGFEDHREASARQAEAASFRKKAAHAVREGEALDHELKHDLSVLAELIGSADQDVQVAESFLKLTESEFNRGVKNGPDLLEAVQKYFDFRDKRTEYYRDFFTTKAELESLSLLDQE